MSLSKVLLSDRQLSAVAPCAQDAIPPMLAGLPCEKTAIVLSSLVSSLESLKDGILVLAAGGNLYAQNALFRVFLEHLLKMMGVFHKSAMDKSDDFANLYLRQIVKEAADYKKALAAAGLADEAPEQFILHPWFDEAAKLKPGELNKFAEPFQYKKLIEMINRDYGPETSGFMNKIIPNYSELSGFVHGGPSTQVIMDAYSSDEAKAARLEEVADLSLAMFCAAKRWLLMFAGTFRPEFAVAESLYAEALERHLR